MTTEDRSPGTSAAGRAEEGRDPLRMTEAEKRMAEWEARHDVAARGHRSAPDALQHYLAHERLVHERLAEGAGAHPAQPAPTRAAGTPQPERPTPSGTRAPRTRGLLRRLLRTREERG